MALNLGWDTGKGDEETGLFKGPGSTAPKTFARTGTMVDRNKALKEFQDNYALVIKQLKDVEAKFSNLEVTCEDSLSAFSYDETSALRADVEAAMNVIKGATLRLNKEVASLRDSISENEDEQVLKMKKTSIYTLENDLAKFSKKVFGLQTRMKEHRRQEARSKLRANQNKEPTEAEVDELAEASDAGTLHNSILYNQAMPAVQKVLRDMEDRHRAAKALQSSVEELHQLFVDMQVMVHKQGEQLDNILTNLEDSHDYISKGNKELTKATKIKTHNMRFQLMIAVVVAVIIAVIAAVVLGTVFGTKPVK